MCEIIFRFLYFDKSFLLEDQMNMQWSKVEGLSVRAGQLSDGGNVEVREAGLFLEPGLVRGHCRGLRALLCC